MRIRSILVSPGNWSAITGAPCCKLCDVHVFVTVWFVHALTCWHTSVLFMKWIVTLLGTTVLSVACNRAVGGEYWSITER